MNRTAIKGAGRVSVHQGFLKALIGDLEVDWLLPEVSGEGHLVSLNDWKKINATVAFKKGEVFTAGSTLNFKHGKVTVKAEVFEDAVDGEPLPRDSSEAMPWEPGIMEVRVASSNQDYRAVFRGVQFEPNRIVAADGFRLHAMDVKTPARSAIIIEGRLLDALNRLRPTRYWFGEHGMYAAGEDWVAFAPSMGDVYPDYMRVVPSEFIEPEVRLIADDWLESLKTAAQTVDSENGYVFIGEDGSIFHDRIEVEGVFSRMPVKQAYNAKYLMEALIFTGGREATLMTSGPTGYTLVRGGDRWAVLRPYAF